jgi:hypothetical protein
MNRRWNFLLYAGFLLALIAFASYFYLLRFPITRDFPWVNLLLFAGALILLATGLARAYRRPGRYRGKVAGPILAALSTGVLGVFLFLNFSFTKHLPASRGAPQVGQKAPDFTLPDANGNPVTLSKLWGGAENAAAGSAKSRWVLLVFYRGYW